MAIKERRTKILLSLFILSDVNFSSVTINEKIQKIFDLSMNQKTKGTISGLIKEGLIKKVTISQSQLNQLESVKSENIPIQPITNDQILTTDSTNYYLTEKGFYLLCLYFPSFRYLKDKWDGKWRILSYEIPEKKRELRDKLRREVAGWGLGPWHRSFWLTPHPIIENLRQLISQKEEEKYVQAFESNHVFGDRQVLIEKVWAKTQLDKKYREMFKKWHDTLASSEEKLDKFQKVINEYVDLLRQDPGLPKELVGESWIGFEAYNIYKEIRSILLS